MFLGHVSLELDPPLTIENRMHVLLIFNNEAKTHANEVNHLIKLILSFSIYDQPTVSVGRLVCRLDYEINPSDPIP